MSKYIVKIKVSFKKIESGWKEYIYIDFYEVQSFENGIYSIEVEDDFNEILIKKVKEKELDILHKGKSKRSYELMMLSNSKTELDMVIKKEMVYEKIKYAVQDEMNDLTNLRSYLCKQEDNCNIFL